MRTRNNKKTMIDSVTDVAPSKLLNSLPEGFGFRRPQVQQYVNSEEFTFLPLVINYGTYWPLGRTGPFAETSSTYATGLLADMELAGYSNTFTVSDVSSYFDALGFVIQCHHFLSEMNTLSTGNMLSTSRAVRKTAQDALSGRTYLMVRRLEDILKHFPFPQHMYDMFIEGFQASRTNTSSASPIRMFAPIQFKPEEAATMDSASIYDAIDNNVNTLFANPKTLELAGILNLGILNLHSYGEDIGYNNATICNVMNLPYFTNNIYEPNTAADSDRPIYYPADLTPAGLLTVARGSALGADIVDSVWRPHPAPTGDYFTQAFDSNGQARSVVESIDLFQASGLTWESGLTLQPGLSALISRTYASTTNVTIGLASVLFLGK